MRYVVACFVLAGLFHVWALFLGEGLPVCIGFLATYSVCLCARGGREAAWKPGNRQPFTVWGHPDLTFRGKICLEEEVF